MATIGAFNRLSADREILALRAAGSPTRRLLWPAGVFAACLCAAAYALSLFGEPWSGASFRRLTSDLLKQHATLAVVEGTFNEALEGMTLYVERVPSPNQIEGVLIVDERADGSEWLVLAGHGTFLNGGAGTGASLRLHHGSIHRTHADGADDRYQIARFESYELRLDSSQLGSAGSPEARRARSPRCAPRRMKNIGGPASCPPKPNERSSPRIRTSRSRSRVLARAAGVPLGLSTGHTGRMSGFGFGVLVVGGYYLLLIGADTVAARAWLPAPGAAWLPNAVLAAATILLVWRMDRGAPRRG
jgi:lipopolysaccharide export system permease protein